MGGSAKRHFDAKTARYTCPYSALARCKSDDKRAKLGEGIRGLLPRDSESPLPELYLPCRLSMSPTQSVWFGNWKGSRLFRNILGNSEQASALFSGSGKNKTSIEEYVNLRFTCKNVSRVGYFRVAVLLTSSYSCFACTLYDAHWWRRLSCVCFVEMDSASPRACMCKPLDIHSLKLLP
jgi:hypothetical protein